MIDERKLIEFIKSDDFSKTINQSKDSLQNVLIQLIKEQTKIGEWISCSERLPERYKNVFVYWRRYMSDYCYIDILFLNDKNEFVNDFGKINGVPLAWMQLPEPYEKADWSDDNDI